MVRPVLHALLSVLLLLPLWLALTPSASAVPGAVAVQGEVGTEVPLAENEPVFTENQAGARDALGLVDLGGGRSAIYAFVASEGELTLESMWDGDLAFAQSRFLAADVNGDGLTDGVVLHATSPTAAVFTVFICSGPDPVTGDYAFTDKTAWTSTGSYVADRAKLAVCDLNADGKDDVVALYDKGNGQAELQRFISTGRALRKSVGWRGSLAWSACQLAAGDVNRDGGGDAIVLVTATPDTRLFAFLGRDTILRKTTYWKGPYASGVKLAAGDVDSDGDTDVACLRDNGDGRAALDVFKSTRKAFSAPAAWWYSGAGAVSVPETAVSCGDLDADGNADILVLSPRAGGSVVATCSSTGKAFENAAWCYGPGAVEATGIACAPGSALILKSRTVVLNEASMASLYKIRKIDRLRYTFTFVTAEFPQRRKLARGKVMVLAPCDPLPYGALRKVLSVSRSGRYTIVKTTQAKLEEAVNQGEVGIGDSYAAEDMVAVTYASPGVQVMRGLDPEAGAHGAQRRVGGLGFDVWVEFCIELKGTRETRDGDASAEGAVTLTGRLDFSQAFNLSSDFGVVRWKWGFIPVFGMKSIRFTSETSQDIFAEARAEARLQFSKEKRLLSSRFNTIVVWFGPIPVTFTPKLSLYVGASGDLKVGVTTSLDLHTDLTTGVEWKRGNWKLINDFDKSFTFVEPQVNGSMNLKAWAGIEAELLIYMAGGPLAAVEPFVALDVDTEADPWWKVTAGLDGKAGVRLDVLDLEKTWDFKLARWLLGQAKPGGRPAQGMVCGRVVAGPPGMETPVGNAYIGVYDIGGSQYTPEDLTTGPDGGFSFGGLTPGEYIVRAFKDPFYPNPGQSITVTIKDGVTLKDRDINLGNPGSGVAGTVRDKHAALVAGAAVELWQTTPAGAPAKVASTTTSAEGVYQLLGPAVTLVPGEYTLIVKKAGFFPREIALEILPTPILQDVELYSLADQRVTGVVYLDPSWSSGEGATVSLHPGYIQPDAPVAKNALGQECVTTADVSGVYIFEGVPVGAYTVVITKPGYVRAIGQAKVEEGSSADLDWLYLGLTDGASPATAHQTDDHIVWPGQGIDIRNATYEFWYKSAGSAHGALAQTSFSGAGWTRPTMYLDLSPGGTVEFGVRVNPAAEASAAWIAIASTSAISDGAWHHVAASHGWAGMRLYIDGHLEASNGHLGAPGSGVREANGEFGLGDNETTDPEGFSALGQFKGLRVSKTQRYWMDFVPPEMPRQMPGTQIIDPLLGGTTGWNDGFVWQP